MKSKYIRFGRIPNDEISRVWSGDSIVKNEVGVSVYDCIEKQGIYKIVIPSIYDGVFEDLIHLLFNDPRKIFLVEGDEVGLGTYGEPCLKNVVIISELIIHNFAPTPGSRFLSRFRKTNYQLILKEK